MITTFGKRAMAEHIAGYRRVYADSMAFGIGTTAATLADDALEAEFLVVPTYVASVDYSALTITYKGQIPQGVAMTVNEIALKTTERTSSPTQYPFLTFSSDEGWSSGSIVSAGRVANALRLNAATSATASATVALPSEDMSLLSPDTEFKVAITTTANVSSVNLRMGTDASNYFEKSWSAASNSAQILSVKKSAMTTTGAPNWGAITWARVAITASGAGATQGDFEILITETPLSPSDDKILARSVVTSIVKTADNPADIEYVVSIA